MHKCLYCFLSLCLMAFSGLHAQVTHEQTYDQYTQVVTYPGELVPKYFQLNANKQQARFYNPDHSLFKTIDIPQLMASSSISITSQPGPLTRMAARNT